MATVDIDLGDVDLDDLVDAITGQLAYKKKFTKREQDALNELRKSLTKHGGTIEKVYADNLADQMKMEFLMELKEKYSESQLRDMENNYNKKTQ